MSTGFPLTLDNEQFNNWKVLVYSFVKYHKRFFKCKCITCGIEKFFCGTELKRGKIQKCKLCNPKKQNLIQKYEKFVIKNPNGCWGWKGYINPGGYGQFRYEMKIFLAHRASWIIHNGPIQNNLWVLHKCDNPICSNPNHLFLGNNLDNNKDCLNKGRHPTIGKFGEENHMSVLTKEKVRQIKKLLDEGLIQNKIAKMFNVSPMTICRIKNNILWKGIS